jgi:uncharacterized protein
MGEKVGRNDPCPCGSGKKYKQCCQKLPGVRKKINAKVLSGGGQKETPAAAMMPDLLQRTFGDAIASAKEEVTPPKPEEEFRKLEESPQEDDKKES